MTEDRRLHKLSKPLSAIDLGLTGSHQAGILLPKSSLIHRLLPPLDALTANPSASVAWWCPQIDVEVVTRYVYYNSKKLGTGTRNEYRLTRLAALLGTVDPAPGDRIVFLFRGRTTGHTVFSEAGSTSERFPQLFTEADTTDIEPTNKWTIEEIPFEGGR